MEFAGAIYRLEAYKWSLLAMKQGHEKAKALVAALQKELTPAQIAEGEKRALRLPAAPGRIPLIADVEGKAAQRKSTEWGRFFFILTHCQARPNRVVRGQVTARSKSELPQAFARLFAIKSTGSFPFAATNRCVADQVRR